MFRNKNRVKTILAILGWIAIMALSVVLPKTPGYGIIVGVCVGAYIIIYMEWREKIAYKKGREDGYLQRQKVLKKPTCHPDKF